MSNTTLPPEIPNAETTPKEWESRNTYFRNQEAIAYAVSKILKIPQQGTLQIIDIGSGVLEPFILAALVRSSMKDSGVPKYQIQCLDRDKNVKLILEYLLQGNKSIFGYPEVSRVIHDEFSLNLTQLAKIFPAPESVTDIQNARLSSAELLVADIRILHSLHVDPADIQLHIETRDHHTENVVSFDKRLFPSISFLPNDFVSDALAFPHLNDAARLIISNFALQYAIQQGMTVTAIKKLNTLFNEFTVFQHGNIYWKEIAFMSSLAALLPLPFHLNEFAIRQVDLVTFESREKPTLRIRTDSIYSGSHSLRVNDAQMERTLKAGEELGGRLINTQSFGELVKYMQELQIHRQELVAYACSMDRGYLVCILPISTLTECEYNPLRLRPVQTGRHARCS